MNRRGAICRLLSPSSSRLTSSSVGARLAHARPASGAIPHRATESEDERPPPTVRRSVLPDAGPEPGLGPEQIDEIIGGLSVLKRARLAEVVATWRSSPRMGQPRSPERS